MMRGVVALAVAVLLAATAPVRGAEAGDIATSPYDGVYALPGARVMCIGDQKFEIFTDSGRLGRVSIAGRAFARSELVLWYFDGEREVETTTTWAIMDGHLWLATLRQGQPGLWYGQAANMNVFGWAGRATPSDGVYWDMKKSVFAIGYGGAHPVSIPGVTAIAAGDGIINDRAQRIVAATRDPAGRKRWRTSCRATATAARG